MKKTFRLIGIITLLAIIGFSMAACSDGNGGNNVSLYRTEYSNVVQLFDIPNYAAPNDFTITIDGKNAQITGSKISTRSVSLFISTSLVAGKSYKVVVKYTGRLNGVAADFFSGTLKCGSQ
jgi:hypothetical protein